MLNQPRSLTTCEKIINIGFNVRFVMLGFFDAFSKSSIARPGDCIYILGQKIEIDKSNADRQNDILFKIFTEIPWLTYRSGFPQLYHDLKGTYVTDTGWGCMIRVGQMAFAQMIRRHSRISDFKQMVKIINFFNDFDKSQPFSIHNISKYARKQYGILPGDWYNPSQISHILSILNQLTLQNQMKLSFLVFNSGNLFFDQVIEVMMGGRTYQRCNCLVNTRHLICTKCNKSQYSLGLVLLARIGLDSPEQKYLSVLDDMMKIDSFSGVIGGRPGKALYLIGVHGDNSYVYLDPHYVQEAQQNIEQIKQTYSCVSFRVCKAKSIDPSFGVCFYIQDLKELNTFYEQMYQIKGKCENDFFIWMNDTTPHYLTKSIRVSKAIELEQDVYQQV